MTPEDNTLMLELALAECRRLRAALDAEQRAHCATHDALTEARAGLAASVPRDVHDRVVADAKNLRSIAMEARSILRNDHNACEDARRWAAETLDAAKHPCAE